MKLIQGEKLNLLIKGPNWYISKHQRPNYNLSFSMPNDAVLDPTVHHLFAKDRFNRGKSSRSWPLYPRCGHDLSPPRCPPFVEAGTPDLLWLYKSQRKAWKSGGNQRKNPESRGPKTRGKQGIEHSKKKGKYTGEEHWKQRGKNPENRGGPKTRGRKTEAKPRGKTHRKNTENRGTTQRHTKEPKQSFSRSSITPPSPKSESKPGKQTRGTGKTKRKTGWISTETGKQNTKK